MPTALLSHETLLARIMSREARVGVIGLGYVGLPLAITAARAGFAVTGFDIDPGKITAIEAGRSYIEAVPSDILAAEHRAGRFAATSDFSRLGACDVIAICVPTPLTRHRDPDMRYVEQTCRDIAATLRPGQLVVLESTTYPGTTDGLVRRTLEAGGLTSGTDFFLGFSPEREDPGNRQFQTSTIPKVVAGDGAAAQALVTAFYGAVVKTVVPVSSTATAEAVKLTENIFRAVNIALVNELKVVYAAMGIDIWEVIDAASSKPFGYMPFYPGPGLGGHCIPIDPFYLTWASRAHELPTRFIELAGEINSTMPQWVVGKITEALNERARAIRGSRVLVLGIAYKKNVDDMRESPSVELMELLVKKGAVVEYSDPHVPVFPKMRQHRFDLKSVPLTAENVAGYDFVVLATNHDAFDYELIARHARLIVDTRGVYLQPAANVVKA